MRVKIPKFADGFTQVPNALIESHLSAGLKLSWIKIASVAYKAESGLVDGGLSGIAKELNIAPSTFYKSVQRLQEAGVLVMDNQELNLIVPDQPLNNEKEEPEKKLALKKEPETIAEEIDQQAKRKPSGVTQKESMAAIAEAWNEAKPEQYMLMDKRMHPSMFIAIETHAKRLKIERPDYPEMIRYILSACKEDSFWKSKSFKGNNLFGWGNDIEDKKFTNVEKLYREGKASDRFSFKDHRKVLAWYNEKWPEITWTEVKTMPVNQVSDAWHHDVNTEPDGTVILYTLEGADKSCETYHWTGKEFNRRMRYTPN
jgi:hypothetical protein